MNAYTTTTLPSVIVSAFDFIERTRCPYFSRLSFRVSRSACARDRRIELHL